MGGQSALARLAARSRCARWSTLARCRPYAVKGRLGLFILRAKNQPQKMKGRHCLSSFSDRMTPFKHLKQYMIDTTRQALERVHRQEYGQLLATLIGWLGDLELAEEALQDALLAAVEHWGARAAAEAGAAHHHRAPKAIDRIRRAAARPWTLAARRLGRAAGCGRGSRRCRRDPRPAAQADLHLLPPALPIEQQIALTLHTLGALTRPRSRRPFWCRCRRWLSAWCGPSARSRMLASSLCAARAVLAERLDWCWPCFI